MLQLRQIVDDDVGVAGIALELGRGAGALGLGQRRADHGRGDIGLARILELAGRGGLVGGLNQALAASRADWVTLLPPGALLSPAAFSRIAASLTDALTTKLGQIGGLRVISRTSAITYRDTRKR